MSTVIDTRLYWLPFPGCWQAVATGADGSVLGEGMGPTKSAAEEAARKNIK